ncbi:DUF6492 family protein [Nitratireductor rhodophyticola]
MAGEHSTAIVTPSYAGDFDRCRLLCETMDRFVSGHKRHYLLVAGHDVERFRTLETNRRVVVDERDLLPSWLHAVRDPTVFFRRHVWLSTRLAPLRGWHVQQLRRIAFAEKAEEETLVYCDSDVVFLKPFDCSAFWQDGQVRLYRRNGGMNSLVDLGHRDWSANAARALGLPAGQETEHDYITTLISWRRDTVVRMLRHVEKVNGTPWIRAVAADRRFSECILYGRYVDEVLAGEGHFHDDRALCHVLWFGSELDAVGVEDVVARMQPYQVAIGIQSFIETDLEPLRRMIG